MESQVVFRGSLKKALMVLLISVGFVVLGAWATTEKPVIGWLCIAFFGLGIPASLLMMRPNSTYLKLDADGIDIVSMSRHLKLKWSEVDAFRMASVRGAKMIAIDYSAEYTKQKAGRAVASALSGMEGAIADHYTVALEQVLQALNDWKTHHGRAINAFS
jgi:hypothetical protein